MYSEYSNFVPIQNCFDFSSSFGLLKNFRISLLTATKCFLLGFWLGLHLIYRTIWENWCLNNFDSSNSWVEYVSPFNGIFSDFFHQCFVGFQHSDAVHISFNLYLRIPCFYSAIVNGCFLSFQFPIVNYLYTEIWFFMTFLNLL